jgi:hypothetical protein
MAMDVLLQAVVDRVKTIMTYDDTQVDVSDDGKPPPFSGQVFAVVHPGEFSNDGDLSLDEKYDVSVTLTFRTGYVPQDRIGQEVLFKTIGIYAAVHRLRAGLHMDYTGMGFCGGLGQAGGKSYSLSSGVNGFSEPLKFRRASKPMVKGPDWFWADGVDDATTGVAVQIDFVGARRIQSIESMT